MNPPDGTGFVATEMQEGSERPKYLSSCCEYRHRGFFLTAAHTIRGLTRDHLYVACPSMTEYRQVDEVFAHPEADLAVLRMDAAEPMGAPFWGILGNPMWGDNAWAFGYIAHYTEYEALVPQGRLYPGYFQRFFPREKDGCTYAAAEVTVGYPPGLCGAPVFRQHANTMLLGLVTGEDTMEMGDRPLYRSGVCILLHPYEQWIHSVVPAPGEDSDA
ncbi:MAG TPA: hypothetical protein VJ787_09120 [Thermoleophilia bacterium]|nr:hypothetical protein [Thermoleophilia bacterium]